MLVRGIGLAGLFRRPLARVVGFQRGDDGQGRARPEASHERRAAAAGHVFHRLPHVGREAAAQGFDVPADRIASAGDTRRTVFRAFEHAAQPLTWRERDSGVDEVLRTLRQLRLQRA